jgi:hypothetical protein
MLVVQELRQAVRQELVSVFCGKRDGQTQEKIVYAELGE